MRKAATAMLFLIAALALLAIGSVLVPALAEAQALYHGTTEVLVLTTPTQIPRDLLSRGFEIYNNGPNTIYCAVANSADAVVNKARPIQPQGFWAMDASGYNAIWCVAATANQLTTAATLITEVRP